MSVSPTVVTIINTVSFTPSSYRIGASKRQGKQSKVRRWCPSRGIVTDLTFSFSPFYYNIAMKWCIIISLRQKAWPTDDCGHQSIYTWPNRISRANSFTTFRQLRQQRPSKQKTRQKRNACRLYRLINLCKTHLYAARIALSSSLNGHKAGWLEAHDFNFRT